MTEPCFNRVRPHWESRQADLNAILNPDDATEEQLEALGFDDAEDASLANYGLAFDYVPHDTFSDQEQGYFRYQLSWGGPADELRIYVSIRDRAAMLEGEHRDFPPERIEYWFLDWFDGASITVTHDATAREVWQWFAEIGAPAKALSDAGTDLDELLDEGEDEADDEE